MTGSRLVGDVVKLGKRKVITGVITDVVRELCSVQMSTRGQILHGLRYIGTTPAVGDTVFIDFQSGIPVVHTNSENLEEAITEVQRVIVASAVSSSSVPAPAPEVVVSVDGVRRFIGNTTGPTVTDDEDLGYEVSDIWADEANDLSYILLDATAGAAIWLEIGFTPGAFDAADVTYTPIDNSKWDANTDPGNVDDALDQLAERVTAAGVSSGGGGGHLHGLARWISSGGTTFDLPDIAEYLEGVSLNGLEEDPTLYSLSADRTQIVFDSATTAADIVVAKYVLAQV